MTGGSRGDGDVGLLRHGHYQAEISPPPEAASSPTPPYDGDVKLEDIADKSQKTKALDPGAYTVFLSSFVCIRWKECLWVGGGMPQHRIA